jgi:3-oxoacyl-[acyl-carrier-protein] synthase II
MSSRRIAVTGLGLVSPAGLGVQENWERVCSGRSTARTDPDLDGLPVDFSCRVPGFDPTLLVDRKMAWRLDRFVHLAIAAAREAVTDARLDPQTWDGARVGVVLGCGLGGVGTWETQHRRLVEAGPGRVSPMLIPMLVPNMVAGQVAMAFGATGPNLVTATACASGTTAIGTALNLLRTGTCDVVLTGGSEAGVSPLIVTAFAQMGALSRRRDDPASASRPFDADRDGFVIAEAAGILVLERLEDATARRSRIRACLAGYGATADAHHATAPDPTGRGVERAIRAALTDAGLSTADVVHVNAHGTSTPLNDATEAKVLHRVFGDAVAVTSTKGVTGHALGAAGAIEAAYAVLAVEHGVIPPTANLEHPDRDIALDIVTGTARRGPVTVALSNSFGFGGQNAVLAVATA